MSTDKSCNAVKTTLTSMRVRFGTSAFTSRMILGLAGASNDFNVTLNIVFSLGFS